MRTFQHIYDFCRSDPIFRAYYDIPDQLECTREQYRYYHEDLGRGYSRSGTYIFCQSQRRLDEFLNGTPDRIHLHFDLLTAEIVTDIWKADRGAIVIHVIAEIHGKGVCVKFRHPFDTLFAQQWHNFIARSHRPFDKAGLISEVTAYVDKHLLFPPGRYRDLQVKNRVKKEDFPLWYCRYKNELGYLNHEEHKRMTDKYRYPLKGISYQKCEDLLSLTGIFDDLNCDEYERDSLVSEFTDVCEGRETL